jgi:non-ribosomal peptide synthetase component F
MTVTKEAPLSFQQERLWFLHQLDPQSVAYNFSAAFEIDGDLRADVLERALRAVASRHHVLRTAFVSERGRPVQRVLDRPALLFRTVDLTSLPPERGRAEQARLAAATAEDPFDLARGETVRVLLATTTPNRHLLLIAFHHIVGDAASVRILMDELVALYDALASGAATRFEPLPCQYADYARRQREADGANLARSLEFWEEYLRGAPDSLELPRDRRPPAVPSGRGAVHEVEVPGEVYAGLRALARERRTTLFTVVLAAFQTLLMRYTGQEDIVVGVPVSDRSRTEYERLIGFFVHTVAVRCDLSGDPTFVELLGRVRGSVLDALEHAATPFEKIVGALRIPRREHHNPLFQVMFSFDEVASAETTEAPSPRGFRVIGVAAPRAGAMFPLSLSLRADARGLRGTLEYSTDLLAPERVTYMAEHLRSLLFEVATPAAVAPASSRSMRAASSAIVASS